jgi:hypothetical protein
LKLPEGMCFLNGFDKPFKRKKSLSNDSMQSFLLMKHLFADIILNPSMKVLGMKKNRG